MALYVVNAVVTVIRDGKRVKVKPNGGPFDFTKEEIESLDSANVRVEPYKAPANATAVVVGEDRAATSAESKPKAKSKTQGKATEVTSSDTLEDEDI